MGDPLRARLLGHGDVRLDTTRIQLRSRPPASATAHHAVPDQASEPAGGNGEQPQHVLVGASVCGPLLCPLVLLPVAVALLFVVVAVIIQSYLGG